MYLIWRSFLQWADWTGLYACFGGLPTMNMYIRFNKLLFQKAMLAVEYFINWFHLHVSDPNIFFVQEDISTIHIQCNLNVWTIKRKLNWKILRIHEVYKYFTYETLYISSSYVFTPSIKPIKVFYQFKLFFPTFL